MRDKLKDETYFNNYINRQPNRIIKFKNAIESNIDNPQADIKGLWYDVFRISYQKLIASYSAGTPVKELTQPYSETVEYMQKGWDSVGGYYQMVWMLSVGILLEVNDEEFNKLVALVDRDKLEDYVIDYLISYRIKGRKISQHLEFPVSYKGIMEVTQLSGNIGGAILRLEEYLNKEWYKGHSDAYWYNNDKSKSDTYFGYWSWESGAVVKIMGLDDSILKSQQYYPYDMVYWKE